MSPSVDLRATLHLAAAFVVLGAAAVRADDARPRLAVVIAVDQMRYDYLERFRPHFVAGGFERLLSGGTNFEDCTYSYAATKTAVGHATMLTGAHPMVHGIVGNEWVNRETLLSGVSVEDMDAPLVGLPPSTMRVPGGLLDRRAGRSPRRLLAPTLGDQLKAVYGAEARVFGASNKDRSAILMAGARADGAYWDESGRIVTSRYYRDTLPAWVEAFNEQRLVDACFGRTWERLLDPAVYDALVGPDDVVGEYLGNGLDRTFPHVFNGGRDEPGADFYSAFDSAPFASEFIAAFVRELVVEENLGADATPDLLCVSFSQVDSLGHNYGPDSHETMDSMLRLDRVLAAFFAFIDERVGAGRWVTVITADHGVAPIPELSTPTRPGAIARRVVARELDARMEAALDAALGTPPGDEPWLVRDNQGYFIRPPTLEVARVPADKVAAALRDALRADPVVEAAFTRAEILAAPAEGGSILALVRRSYHEQRGQDVCYVVKSFFVEKSEYGTTHGTPWRYDRHVPQLWYGAGISRGWRTDPVGMEDIAPTLAALLGVPPPEKAAGRRLF